MSARLDCLLAVLEVFLLLPIFGDSLEPAEFILGLSGRVEEEERDEEVLCFLGYRRCELWIVIANIGDQTTITLFLQHHLNVWILLLTVWRMIWKIDKVKSKIDDCNLPSNAILLAEKCDKLVKTSHAPLSIPPCV